MKIKNLILAGLFVLGMTACSNNDEPNGPDTGNGLNGSMVLTISGGSMNQTRTAEHGDGTEVGTDAENTIHDLTVVLTNASGVITNVVPITVPADTKGAFTTPEFKVGVGTHLVYALINNASAVAVNQNIAQVLQNATADNVTKGFKDGKFFMTNEQHLTDKTPLDAGKSVTIAAGGTETVNISVDRLAARITDKTTAPAFTDLKALFDKADANFMDGVKVIGFVPMNLNPDMNIIQTWIDQTPQTGAAEKILSTPAPTAYLLPVATYKEENTEHIGIKDLTVESDYMSNVYATENRPAMTFRASDGMPTAKRGEATAVIYRVVVTKGGTAVPTFYTYNNVLYLDYAVLVKALEGTVDDLTGIGATDYEEMRAKHVLAYADGVMYYTFFIRNAMKDTNGDYKFNYLLAGKPYYSVFRNSVYNLNITAIKEIGDDVPEDDKNPTDPIDPDDAKLIVDVKVNEWVLNEIEIEF